MCSLFRLPRRLPRRPPDHLTLLLDSTGEGIFGIDMDGRCTFVNQAAARTLGFSTDMVLGRNMHELIHHSHADGRHYPECECPIFNAFRRGLPCRIDDEVIWRADGSSFAAEYSSHPIIENGVVRGAVVTFIDISERKRAEELLRRSHDEMGSLLVALKMDLNWLEKRVGDDAQRPAMVAKCQRMGGLVDTAVDAVGCIITDLRPSILDHQGLWAALEWQAQEFAHACSDECEVDFKMFVAADVPPPEGGLAIAVFRILQEVLSNVARHARARKVAIRIDVDAPPLSVLYLQVRDDGVGTTPEALDDPQAWSVMGLCERAAHFGGRVGIETAPGRGTTVRLMLPLTAPDAPGGPS